MGEIPAFTILTWEPVLFTQRQMKITSTSSSLHRSKSFHGRCALEENCISRRHFWLQDSYFPQGALLPEPYSCNFMLTRQVLLTKVIHVLNQVQNKTAFIHYFYKAITNDSLACDLFRKNYEPFTSLLVTSGSFAFWFIVIFLEGLVPQVNDQILLFVLTERVWGLPLPSGVSDDPGKWSAQPLLDQHRTCLNAGHSLRKTQQKTLVAGFGPTSRAFLAKQRAVQLTEETAEPEFLLADAINVSRITPPGNLNLSEVADI